MVSSLDEKNLKDFTHTHKKNKHAYFNEPRIYLIKENYSKMHSYFIKKNHLFQIKTIFLKKQKKNIVMKLFNLSLLQDLNKYVSKKHTFYKLINGNLPFGI